MLHDASNKRQLPIRNRCLAEKNSPLSCGQKHTTEFCLIWKAGLFNKITEILKSDCKYASSHIVKALVDDKQQDKSKASHDK